MIESLYIDVEPVLSSGVILPNWVAKDETYEISYEYIRSKARNISCSYLSMCRHHKKKSIPHLGYPNERERVLETTTMSCYALRIRPITILL